MLFSPFLLCFWFMGKPWHTASRKKIKYLGVVSAKHEQRKDILSSQAPPRYPQFYMKVATARLNGSAQNLSGVPCFWIQRSPLAPSLGTSGFIFSLLLDDVVYPHDLVGIVGNIGFGVCVGVAPVFVIPNNVGTGSKDGDFHSRHLPFH